MNKTLSIALAGFSFMIEENAYMKLSDYLTALRRSMEPDEANEVMQDIELRIVEIFKDRLGKQREVVNYEDVEAVIALIGTPEQIDEQEQEYTSREKTNFNSGRNTGNFARDKQLFRDPENKMIGGVSGGLANYLGIDIVWVRLAFVLLLFAKGFGALVYVILWIVVPKAKTAGDFLKMKGKPLNFDNLKEQSNKVVQFATDSTEKVNQVYQNNKPQVDDAGKTLWKIFRVILGVFFLILTIGCIIGTFAVFGVFGAGGLGIEDNFDFYMNEHNLGYVLLGVTVLSIIIPAAIFLLLAIKLLSPKTKLNYTGYVLGGLVVVWIGLITALATMGAKYSTEFNGYKEEKENISINTKSDSLYLEQKEIAINPNFKFYWNSLYSDKKTIFKKDNSDIDITRKDDVTVPYLIIKKSASGSNQPLEMTVPVEIVGNKILFPDYINYPYKYRLRKYDVDYELVIPKKMVIINNSNLSTSDRDDNDKDNHKGASLTITSDDDNDTIIIKDKKIAVKDIQINPNALKKDSIKGVDIHIKSGKDEVKINTK